MDSEQDLQSGATELLGHRVEGLVGRGGMGVVYLAWDALLKRHVAVKLIAPELSGDPRFRERFLAESELAASLEHPNVVPIYEAGEVDGQLVIAMRHVQGTDLRRLLAAEGPLAPARSLAICAWVADALDAAHERGLVHRDVKPSNILLDERERAYLADFGLSAQVTEQHVREGRSLGTAAYAAPEQIQGGPVDARTDVYSLGCVLYECLTGEIPYPRERELAVLWAHLQDEPPQASARSATLPEAIDPVLVRALAKDPTERFTSCGELVLAARDALGLRDVVFVRDRKPLLVGAVGILLALAAALGALIVSRGDGPSLPSTRPTLTPVRDSLQRIDPETNTLVATTGLGPQAAYVAVGEGAAYVLDLTRHSVSRVDQETNEVTVTSGAGVNPFSIAAGAGAVWVRGDYETFLTRLDAQTLTATQSYNFDQGVGGSRAAAGDDAIWFLVGDVLFRVGDDNLVRRVTRIAAASPLIAAGGGNVWVYSTNATVARVDARTGAVVARVTLDTLPTDMAADTTGAWIVDRAHDRVEKIGLETNSVVARIPVGDDPAGVAAGAGAVWVANLEDGTVSRLDPRTNRVVATIEVGPRPSDIAAGDDGVWVVVHAH